MTRCLGFVMYGASALTSALAFYALAEFVTHLIGG